ncbi:MAG: amidohydrolase family protein [Persicimonas sp.]
MPYRQLLVTLLCAGLLAGCATGAASEGDKDNGDDEASADDVDWPEDMVGQPRDLTPVSVDPETVVIRDATIMTATGDRIEGGDLLLEEGRIEEISEESIEAPEGAEVVEADGRYVTPGIIDTHSHLGVYPDPSIEAHSDGNESTSPSRAEVDANNSVWPQDPGLFRALAGGVTALQILPGSANIAGGRTTTLQMHPGISARAMQFEGAPDGLKMACGENPKRVYGEKGQMPSTRMGNSAVFRNIFQKARETQRKYEKYREKLAEWEEDGGDEDDKPDPPSRDFAMESVMAAMNGDLLLHVHCYRADEIVKILELADAYDFEVRSFHHALEAYKVRDILAEWDVAVSTWADWWGSKAEMHDAIPENAPLVADAGGRAVIHSDSATDIQRLNQEAAKAMWEARHAGMEISENEALRWITANAAWTLGIHDKTGTLEKGKRADVVLWSENPFSVYAEADKVWVEGVREFDRSKDPEPWSDFEVSQFSDPADKDEE